MNTQKPINLFGLALFAVLSFLLPAGVVALTVAAVGGANADLLSKPEVQLPIVLIATVLAVTGGLSFLVVVLAFLGLTTPKAALGMPEGSIRAVIAISLLFLFMILAVFLYANLAGTTSSDAAKAASVDVAKQLVTTVATLAVSVAGFYFGTSSVAAAASAVSQVQRSVRLLSPASPVKLAKAQGTASPDIIVAAQPPDQAIDWHIDGDSDGTVEQKRPGVFVYRRGTNPGDQVTLHFFLVGHPDVQVALNVTPN